MDNRPRCIYCWEELALAAGSDEPAWHDACERRAEKSLTDAVVLGNPDAAYEMFVRTLQGKSPLRR